MSRLDLFIGTEAARTKAADILRRAPLGFHVQFKRNKRSNDQNALMWVLLGHFSQQCELNGQRFSSDDWKIIFMEALGHEMRLAPSLSGSGFVSLGRRSSRLTKDEMSNLIELIYKEGAERGVDFKDDRKKAA